MSESEVLVENPQRGENDAIPRMNPLKQKIASNCETLHKGFEMG